MPRLFLSDDPHAEGPDVIWLEHDGDDTAYIRGIKGDINDVVT